MHILAALIGFLIAVSFWWYRLKIVKDASKDAIDALGRTRGKMRRNKIKKQSSLSAITALNDPIDVAATIILSILSDETINQDFLPEESQVDAVRHVIRRITNEKRAEETAIYARWAVTQVVDARVVIDKGALLLNERLTYDEKKQFIALLDEAGALAGKPSTFETAKKRLEQRLGVQS